MEFTTSTLGVALDAGTALVAEQVPDIVWALVVLFGAVIGIVVVKAVLNSATRKIGGAVGGGGKKRKG